jgi:DNA-binding NarL/FixJ family response regulator
MSDIVPSSVIRVFLLIENLLLREALVRLLRKRSDLLVVGQSGAAKLTVCDVLDSKCDVLLVSFSNWLASNFAVESLGIPGLRVVVIGMDAEEAPFLAAVRSGVTGYLLKDASAADVVDAIRAVFRGEAVCPPQLCATLFHLVAQMPVQVTAQSPTSRLDLTLRQQQLVALVAKGLTNKEIAARLNLSEYTVRNHIHRILKQVDAGSRSEAVDVIRASGVVLSV